MLTYNLKIALKFLRKNKAFAAINLIGLSIALAVSFIIILYVVNELSYNSCHKNRNQTYRVLNYYINFKLTQASTPFIMASTLREEYPQIKNAINTSWIRGVSIKQNDEFISIRNPVGTSSEVFDVFTLPLISSTGTEGLLDDNYSICLSQSLAVKLFENGDAVGKELTALINNEEQILRVTAVYKDIPENSSFKADCMVNGHWTIAPINQAFEVDNADINWTLNFWTTWVLLYDGVDPNLIESQFRDFEKKYVSDKAQVNYSLQNLSDVYLRSDHINNPGLKGNMRDIRLFSTIAFLILLVAAINYIILSTAVSIGRTKEIAVRKTNGANSNILRRQLLVESVLLTLMVLPIAYYLMMLALPYASGLFQKKIHIIQGNIIYYALVYLALTVIIGLASGLYTSTWLSRLKVLEVLKSSAVSRRSKIPFRSILIVLQLVIFSFFVSSTLIVNSQYRFALKMNPGYNNENMLFVNIGEDFDSYKPLLEDIRNNSNVIMAAGTAQELPMRGFGMITIPHSEDKDVHIKMVMLDLDLDFLETMGIELMEGRFFSRDFPSDLTHACILNQTAVKQLGLSNPLGYQIIDDFSVIGVVNDFYFQSLHEDIHPLTIVLTNEYIEQIVVRFSPDALGTLLQQLNEIWEKYSDTPFKYSLVEDLTAKLYVNEKKLFAIATVSAIFTMLIAAMGLFGLTLFIAQRRTKEIGIRKVLGSSTTQIVLSFIKTNLLYVLVAVAISTPITIIIMQKWLNNYAERIDIGWWVFALTFAIAAVVVVLTVLAHSYRAARVNPVEALRYE